MSNTVKATFYAEVVPTFGWRYDDQGKGDSGVKEIRVTRIWQKRPTGKTQGVVVKLTLQFNEEAFLPLQPAAVISIPDSMVQAGNVVEVEALDENDSGVAEHLARLAKGGGG